MYTIGVDLGGTNIVSGVIDENHAIISKATAKTELPRPSDSILDDIAMLAGKAAHAAGLKLSDISYLGVGTPGGVDAAGGVVEFSNNLDFKNLPMAHMLRERLGIPVYIENDANCAALGEQLAGCGKGAEDLTAVTLGTGIGGGIVTGGKILHGINGTAGEIGHMSIDPNGIQCSCGRRGCFEKYASATALISQTKQAMKEHKESYMWSLCEGDPDKVNGKTAFDGAEAGDSTAKAVVDRYIFYLACGITNLVNIFQPEILCIGGGICNQGDTLLVPLREIVEKERYSKFSVRQTSIVRAVLGNDAGLIGAGSLI